MKKKLCALALCVIMVVALAAPAFAEQPIMPRGAPPLSQNAIIRNVGSPSQILTVASSGLPGLNDEVWTWNDRGMSYTQRWNFINSPNGFMHYFLCAGSAEVAVNVYHVSGLPCTMFTAGGSNMADTDMTVATGATSSQYLLVNISNYLCVSKTSVPKYKFADGNGFGTQWVTPYANGNNSWTITP